MKCMDDLPSCNRIDTVQACVNEAVDEVKEKDLPRVEDFKDEDDQQEKNGVEDKKELSTTSGEGLLLIPLPEHLRYVFLGIREIAQKAKLQSQDVGGSIIQNAEKENW
ncbi:hypothetical protein ACH5RR_018381 [Cinchona calisaya]|uniref:Uncharacterized protein n=1 Tax=Cinchona calisaya TaxID=153742 RepID=A0ABD2ZPZ9_9GENT